MSTCSDVGSVIESKMSVVQTSNVGFTSEVEDYLVMHTGPGEGLFSKQLVDVNVILNIKKRDVHPFQKQYQRKKRFAVDVSIDWTTGRRRQTKLPDRWKVIQIYTIQNKLRTNCSQTCQRQSFELNDLKF